MQPKPRSRSGNHGPRDRSNLIVGASLRDAPNLGLQVAGAVSCNMRHALRPYNGRCFAQSELFFFWGGVRSALRPC